MLVTLKTFNAHTLNSSSYETVLLNPHASSSVDTVFVDQSQADPQDAGTYTVNKQTKVLSIRIKNYGSRYSLVAQLKTWFKRGTRGTLVGTFSDDGIDYQLDCRAINLIPDPQDICKWTVTLETGNSAWRSVDLVTEATWVVTGTSETQDIAVGGHDETYLSLNITTDTSPAVGYLKQRLYQLPNTPGIEHGLIGWCIELDTAALVTAGEMQADCDDLRFVDLNTGLELNRWIDSPNDANTKVWINLDLKKGFSLVLATTVANTGLPAYLQFAVNATNKASIAAMPKTGIVYHGNEWFAYTNTDSVNCRLALGARELFGTTIETHTAGVSFLYIQYPLLMKFGNSSAVAPSSLDTTYDDTKPLINLADSTNTSWVWDATTKFYDPDHPLRTCGWKFGTKALYPNSKTYYIKQDAETGDPAMGLWAENYQIRTNSWRADTVTLTATFYRAATITTVSMTGEKYRSAGSAVGGFPSLAALRRGVNGLTYFNLWTETYPSAGSWTAFTHNSVAVATGSAYLQFIFNGEAGGASASFYYAFEALTCTAVFTSANIPTGAFIGSGSEDAFTLDLTIANETDADYDDSVNLDFIMLLDKALVIDGENRTVLYDGANAYGALVPDDESRSAFIRLKGGATNTIRISGTDLGGLSVVMSYYRRRL